MKRFFGFGSSTPPPPPPPSKPPAPPVSKAAPAKSAPPSETVPIPSIVDKWREPGGSETTEFRADGTVLEKPASGETIRGHYTLEGAKLKIRLEGVPEELAFSVNVKQDALEMTDPDGSMTRYARVK